MNLFGEGSLQDLIKNAMNVKNNMDKVKEELKNKIVTGESGAGMVKVTITGNFEVKKIEADDSITNDKVLMLELIKAATNDALRKIEKEISSSMLNSYQDILK